MPGWFLLQPSGWSGVSARCRDPNSSRMKIGISCYPVYGGSGVVATELGKALAARGHKIHFIAYSMPFRLTHVTENIFFHEVSVNTYPVFDYPPYALSLTSKMVDVVMYEQLDLLHVHYAIPHALSAVLARDILQKQGIEIPVVTTLHGTDITVVGRDPSFAPVVTYSINQSDGVTAVSNNLRKATLDAFQIENPIEVIPNFIDTDRFRRLKKEHFKRAICPGGEKVIVHISNFRPVKNASHVVQILHRLRGQGMPVKLLLVGDGPDRASLERLARELGVQSDIHFLGKQGPVEEILSIADAFVMPSGFESFGLAALEAMACGVPVICSNIGGLPELVEGSNAGFLCPLGDIEAFTACVRSILEDEDLRGRMGEAARLHAVRQFDTKSVVSRYEAYYERIRKAGRGPE